MSNEYEEEPCTYRDTHHVIYIPVEGDVCIKEIPSDGTGYKTLLKCSQVYGTSIGYLGPLGYLMAIFMDEDRYKNNLPFNPRANKIYQISRIKGDAILIDDNRQLTMSDWNRIQTFCNYFDYNSYDYSTGEEYRKGIADAIEKMKQ